MSSFAPDVHVRSGPGKGELLNLGDRDPGGERIGVGQWGHQHPIAPLGTPPRPPTDLTDAIQEPVGRNLAGGFPVVAHDLGRA